MGVEPPPAREHAVERIGHPPHRRRPAVAKHPPAHRRSSIVVAPVLELVRVVACVQLGHDPSRIVLGAPWVAADGIERDCEPPDSLIELCLFTGTAESQIRGSVRGGSRSDRSFKRHRVSPGMRRWAESKAAAAASMSSVFKRTYPRSMPHHHAAA